VQYPELIQHSITIASLNLTPCKANREATADDGYGARGGSYCLCRIWLLSLHFDKGLPVSNLKLFCVNFERMLM
jgi:hypothetical protein